MSAFESFDDFYDVAPAQRLMLEALVLPPPRDQESFVRWAEQPQLDALDAYSKRLIPALFEKFGGLAPGPLGARMGGVYRHAHLRNSCILADGRGAIAALLDAGIDVLLFKGIALALKYYRSPATRPMTDVDVLVRPDQLARAEEVLLRGGWRYAYPEHRKPFDRHSHDYHNARRSGFDLHWYALLESAVPGIDGGLWTRATGFDWEGLRVRVMAPEDLLLACFVNGMRDIHPFRANWAVDAVRIVAREPAIEWRILWGEATKRGVRTQVFDALCLLRGLSARIVPDAVLHAIVDGDPEFGEALLRGALAEGRTHGLSEAARREGAAADAPDRPRHVRYFLDPAGGVEKIHLQWRHVPLLDAMFDIGDAQALKAQLAAQRGTTAGWLQGAPARMALRKRAALPAYDARIRIVDAIEELVMAPGEIRAIGVEVENTSNCCWPVIAGDSRYFGVTYHLLAGDGSVLVNELPRTYLAVARRGYIAFIEPGQKLRCDLMVYAPEEVGTYAVQVDFIHELVAWFSERGCRFPRIRLEVRPVPPLVRYAAGPGVVQDTRAHHTALIDMVKGRYYTTHGYGSLVWDALVAGYDAAQIEAAFDAAGLAGADAGGFVQALLAEGLIVPRVEDGRNRRTALRVEPQPGAAPAALTYHGGLQELIAMDPLRGASTHRGWPHPPDTA